ncbi:MULTISPECIES: ABC transporter ATP-binding protein [Prochlorococcus]|uniref:ABC-type multidrug transport system ATPase and permease components n=1 Tax=Prochlorococcus marinus (strain SARG / CCMP1375 / SS120) TaxID=167539 RepID=Q7VD21_PROMA|nr:MULTISPECIES: ABC transporter ATP-binding protein [Prochlorococcus]AAP99608.1 ABC-type multidrug transport system ATPase and permease components [Prochlorococcus marinus subsp. marinus str. CCMP1375]KGG11122.1 putative multidrug efflux ABC transporter [Prochlorococcus marinus str. LG]KGG23195.1 putative multidrug efflux ABC transporter [Prochlorococcus marinus str. SS35]KGG33906.1 putative multidrug efflux ABC transporter [Prochlorococcus marinus str. SS51]KGG36745.1 putative multidrug effl
MATNDFHRVQRLGRYLRQDKKRLLIILFLLLPLSFAGAVQPLLVGQAISVLKDDEQTTSLFLSGFSVNSLILFLLFSVLVRLALQGYQSYNIQSVGQSLTARIRKDLFSHAINLSLKYHDSMPVGKLLTRLTSDVDALSEVFGSGAVGVLADAVTLVVISITMLLIDIKLGLLLLTTQIPVTYLVLWLQKRYRKANYRVREELSQLNADFQENLQGIEVVQMFRRQNINAKQFNRTGMIYRNAVNSIIFYDSSISAFIEWVSLAVVAFVIIIGGWFVTEGSMGLGTLTAFILYSQRLFEPLRQLAERFTQIQGGLTAVERIGELLEEEIEISDIKIDQNYKDKTLNNSRISSLGEVVFDNVSFSYRSDDQIINNLSFRISPGEHVALVGPTGSGKTTLIRLLCRLYEPQEGRIFIDGTDIRDIPLHRLRKQIGVVLQDTFLFSGNVADNLRLDAPINDEDLLAICKELGLNSLLNRFPDGLNTLLRERGGNISSGERQLLSVARVAIRNPNILIMDEATAFMDPSTEATLQRDLNRVLEKRTALVIAHRLATIESSDRILVMKKGELIEQGSHQELRSLGGLYSQLAKLQEQGLAKF